MHEIPLFYAGFSDSEDEKNLFFPPRLPVWEDFLSIWIEADTLNLYGSTFGEHPLNLLTFF